MHKSKSNSTKIKLPIFAFVFFGILVFSLIVYISSLASPGFADLFNSYPGAAIRTVLAWATNLLPLSLAEILIIALPAVIILIAVLAYKKYCKTWRDSIIFTVSLLSAVSLLFSSFILAFGCGYHGKTLDVKLGLEKKAVSPKELEDTAAWLAKEVNALASEITYTDDGFSDMPYSIHEMNNKLMDAYDKICERYGFIQKLHSRVKPVMLSVAMSYTHITGVYTYFTGEANINVDFPANKFICTTISKIIILHNSSDSMSLA